MGQNFQVMTEIIIIEVRANNTNQGDASNYKASIKRRLFGIAFQSGEKTHQMSTDYVEPEASSSFHS